MHIIKSIQNRIYDVRDERVMLDFDLAFLYEVDTKVLNQAVKRNIKRFPDDFMFQLSVEEWESMRSQFVTASENINNSSSQIVMMNQNKRNTATTPSAFTEQGVAMLSGILNSYKAINMNIAIMRVFVDIRKILIKQGDIKGKLDEIMERVGEHDIQLHHLYQAMENLIDEKAAQKAGKREKELVLNKIKITIKY